ncbi:MAG: pyridoxamine 5'-phosphate oxidase family protein [SAR324 cluster bacterium]|nr:pyridoxamine 5'-phosphate oxidase family protein [SAR324 cluster bacterium]MCZ6557195.1 pyridoxamine 5'-phosphate oxidase family protein [SAR324 cluster bacterium]MCZ6647026.1 pyridoxamine 5'-phosphate oxidase family protein [SAR324 cluster bacterium]MCZ6728651.1 pyridoxamine 5'-phosphate oxidase family protein [SAR324 cluster bacterium]MCZ6842877.1 pyridoxamine 5'-phosphate oxidase family protein [SAR324 cluster bacterium]
MGIELSQAEIDEYMLRASRTILCISREGKAPLAVPMWFGWMERKIYISTLLASKKVGYVRENPLVSCLVESGEDYFTLKSVLLMGTCEVIDDQQQALHYGDQIFETKPLYKELFPDKLPPHLEKFYQLPRAILRITPHSTTTWDFSKVRH